MQALISLVLLVLDVIAIVELVKSSATTGKKVLWALLIIFIPVVGLVLYYLLGRKKAA